MRMKKLKRIFKLIVWLTGMTLFCGCGEKKVDPEQVLQEITTTGECGDNLEWKIYDGVFDISLRIIGNGEMENYPLEQVPWKGGKKYIVDFSAEEGITSIGENAFNECEKLRWIHLPEGLLTIENNAFANCIKVISIELPESLQSIGDEAFAECRELRDIKLPDNLEYIGSRAFENCAVMEGILIPSSVEYIGQDAFKDCNSLKYISYAGTQAEWEQIEIEDNADLDDIPIKYDATSILEK